MVLLSQIAWMPEIQKIQELRGAVDDGMSGIVKLVSPILSFLVKHLSGDEEAVTIGGSLTLRIT
jgi:hypothetical protein